MMPALLISTSRPPNAVSAAATARAGACGSARVAGEGLDRGTLAREVGGGLRKPVGVAVHEQQCCAAPLAARDIVLQLVRGGAADAAGGAGDEDLHRPASAATRDSAGMLPPASPAAWRIARKAKVMAGASVTPGPG